MTKIYKLVIGKGQAYRWNQLPEADQKSLWDKAESHFKEVGGERILWVDSSWSAEAYAGYFIEVYPTVEALQKFTAYLNEMKFLQYFDVRTIVGTEESSKLSTSKLHQTAGTDKIYKLVVGKGQAYRWNQLPEADQKSLWEKAESRFKEVGAERILEVDSSWSSEEYPVYFVEVYPNVEALQKFTAYLNELKFLQYFDVITIIGTQSAM
jgi:hypothetical protein